MSTLTNLILHHEIDDFERVLVGKWRDTSFPRMEQIALEAMLRDQWQMRLRLALLDLRDYNTKRVLSTVRPDEQKAVIEIFSKHLDAEHFSDPLGDMIKKQVGGAFTKGKGEVAARAARIGHRVPKAKELNALGFGVLFGYTEQHAVEALKNILRVSAGGFWDEQMSDVLRGELDKLFSNEVSRGEFVDSIEKIVNTRLSAEGQSTLPKSYFKGTTEFLVAQTRSFGKSFQMTDLDISYYRILNPRDKRTAPLCRKLSEPGKKFRVERLKDAVTNVLGATSLADLKDRKPFADPQTELAKPPGPTPFFWKCRCTEEPII